MRDIGRRWCGLFVGLTDIGSHLRQVETLYIEIDVQLGLLVRPLRQDIRPNLRDLEIDNGYRYFRRVISFIGLK